MYKNLRRVGMETGRLTLEEWQYVDREIVEAVHPRLVGRLLYALTPLPHAGFMQVKYYERTDMSQAQISMRGLGGSRDRTVKTPDTINVPVTAKNFDLHWREVLAARYQGLPMDVQEAANAGIQVSEEEDKLMLSGQYTGWPAYNVQGFTSRTGRNSVASTGAWPLTAFADINLARAALKSSGFQGVPFALVARAADITDLDGLIANQTKTYKQALLDNGIVQAIFESDNLFANDGGIDSAVVCVPGKQNFDLLQGQAMTTFLWQDEDMNILGKVYTVVVPRIRQPTSVCEITGVT